MKGPKHSPSSQILTSKIEYDAFCVWKAARICGTAGVQAIVAMTLAEHQQSNRRAPPQTSLEEHHARNGRYNHPFPLLGPVDWIGLILSIYAFRGSFCDLDSLLFFPSSILWIWGLASACRLSHSSVFEGTIAVICVRASHASDGIWHKHSLLVGTRCDCVSWFLAESGAEECPALDTSVKPGSSRQENPARALLAFLRRGASCLY